MALLVVIAPALRTRQQVMEFGRITIEGKPTFIDRVSAALTVLNKKDPEAYELVERYARRITEGQHSGMWAYEDPPRMEIGPRTAESSTT